MASFDGLISSVVEQASPSNKVGMRYLESNAKMTDAEADRIQLETANMLAKSLEAAIERKAPSSVVAAYERLLAKQGA